MLKCKRKLFFKQAYFYGIKVINFYKMKFMGIIFKQPFAMRNVALNRSDQNYTKIRSKILDQQLLTLRKFGWNFIAMRKILARWFSP